MPSAVILHPFDAIAGSQRVAVNIAQALETDGYSVDVILGFGSDGFVSRWVGVKRFLNVNNIMVRKILYPVWLFAVVPRILRAVVTGEIVWANTVHAAPAAFLAILFAPRRVVIHVHEVEFPRVFMYFLRFASSLGATLLCVTDFQRRALSLDAQTLPNCVSVLAEATVARNKHKLVFVGNTSAAKGFPMFIEVARSLTGSGLTPVAFLPSPDRSNQVLLAQAESAGIIVRYGVTDPYEMYEAGYLSLLCTDPDIWTETFSLVAVESMSCLVPVASAGTRVIKEILAQSLAFDVPSRDPEKIASEIRMLLSDPARYEFLVEACRVRREEYTLELFQRRVRALVTRLVERGLP